MNKRIISLAITLVLILCSAQLMFSTASAVSDKGISASAGTVERESDIVVSFTIGKQTKAVSELSLKFTFNNSVFELSDYNVPDLAGAEKSVADNLKANHITASNTNGSVAFGYNSSDGEASVTLSGFSATFTFKAKTDAALGSYSFTVTDYDIGSLDKYGMPVAVCGISSLTAAEKNVSIEVTAKTASDACAHDFIEKADIKYLVSAATCKSAAVYYKSCSKCGERDTATFTSGDKDSANHTASDWIVDKAATESAEGSRHKECILCGKVLETAEIGKTSSDTSAVTEPVTSPVTEPITDPITEPDTDPDTEPVTEPDTDSDPDPDTEPVAEPDTDGKGNTVLWLVIALAIIAGGIAATVILVRKKKSGK